MITVLDKFNPEIHYFNRPYPHVVIENCLPDDLYKDLEKNFPHKKIKENLPCIQGHTYRYLANDVLFLKTIPVSDSWTDFFKNHTSQKFYNKVLSIFDKDIPYSKSTFEKNISVRGNAGSEYDIVTDTQFVVHTPTSGTTRTTHLDNPQELYAGLLYFKQINDKSTGGDFEIYETENVTQVFKSRGREVPEEQNKKLIRTVKYKPNTFVMFLNTNKSVHGVTPRQDPILDRLSVNIIAETNNKRKQFFQLFDTATL